MRWFLYIVECSNGALYTGVTKNVLRRIYEHNETKKGAKSLRNKLPVVLKYTEILDSYSEALKREKEIKGWKKSRKLALITN